MFGNLFKSKKNTLLGIDISSTACKLIELEKIGSRYRVESFAVEPLPEEAMSDRDIRDPEIVAETLKRLIQRSGTHIKQAAVSVSGSSVITKIIQMDHDLNDNEMENQIEVEADQYIPYPLEEVALDFQILGESEKMPDKVDVLLAASRSENVYSRVDALELAGLSTKVVDIEAYSIERAFKLLNNQIPDKGEGLVIAIVDVGASNTSLSILESGKTIYTREQTFGGSQLTEEIQRRYGLSYEEAGQAKKQGNLPDDYEPEVLEPFKEAIIQQVSRSLQFFYGSSQYNEVDHIILAGGCAVIEGLESMIEKRLSCKASIANPFEEMSLSSKVNVQALTSDAASLIHCCGLALRSFD
jgi:type IV pilus assembly protein PilM